MRKFTFVAGTLLCAALLPASLRAQDSSVTLGDNGGHGTLGGKGNKGSKKQDDKSNVTATTRSAPIGALHPSDHGFRKDNGKNHDVRETSRVPYCFEAKNTSPSGLYPLKGTQWTLSSLQF